MIPTKDDFLAEIDELQEKLFDAEMRIEELEGAIRKALSNVDCPLSVERDLTDVL